MILVLDTHVWLWWIEQDTRLPRWLAAFMADPATPIALSTVSVYELGLGVARGRIVLNRPLAEWVQQATLDAGIQVLRVTMTIASVAGQLPRHHQDPLDRLIIATAITHRAQLASLDHKFPLYSELTDALIKRDDAQ